MTLLFAFPSERFRCLFYLYTYIDVCISLWVETSDVFFDYAHTSTVQIPTLRPAQLPNAIRRCKSDIKTHHSIQEIDPTFKRSKGVSEEAETQRDRVQRPVDSIAPIMPVGGTLPISHNKKEIPKYGHVISFRLSGINSE